MRTKATDAPVRVIVDGTEYVPKSAVQVPLSQHGSNVYPTTPDEWFGRKLSDAPALFRPLCLMPADHFGLYYVWEAIFSHLAKVPEAACKEDEDNRVICPDTSIFAAVEPAEESTVQQWVDILNGSDGSEKIIIFTGCVFAPKSGGGGDVYIGISNCDGVPSLMHFRAVKTDIRKDMVFACVPM